ncbi:uncharacterized protein LOC129582941 [Paramacrobiotus metropolitanus]|uniref:uncharacterized protein LOC129582941 n=1 Tax=Paramacrobiotus metropolitanus TaxID=2943436 RepID=UPI00244589E4|nr:uncharacterized protein LOC129582941 [Paramacrobiotus metropolitanus]
MGLNMVLMYRAWFNRIYCRNVILQPGDDSRYSGVELSNRCAEIVYMPQSLGASFILEVDNFVLVNKTVSARDPAPLCYTIPQIPLDAQLCLQVYDLDFNWAKLDISGCVNFQGKLEGMSILTIKLGCFNLPLKEAPRGLHEREEL